MGLQVNGDCGIIPLVEAISNNVGGDFFIPQPVTNFILSVQKRRSLRFHTGIPRVLLLASTTESNVEIGVFSFAPGRTTEVNDVKGYCEICGCELYRKYSRACWNCKSIRQADMKKRRGNDQALKSRLLNERGNSCQNCGKQTDLMMHHVTEIRNGGLSTPENCILLCLDCHKEAHGGRAVGVPKQNRKR